MLICENFNFKEGFSMADLTERDTTAEIRAAVENFFEQDKIKFTPFDEHNVASAIYNVDTKFGHATIFFRVYKDRLVFHFIIPLNAGEEERSKVAEFLLRANYGLKVGRRRNFLQDFNLLRRRRICAPDLRAN